MENVGLNSEFWAGRRVLVTGHTGFKGAWLSLWLRELGADVAGLADGVPTSPSLYELAGIDADVRSHVADVRDADAVTRVLRAERPEVVLHLAAQSLVRPSFRAPRETYEVNVMGTVNVLDGLRESPETRAAVIVTSDKCYENREWEWAYREDEPMGGADPYSSSKGCAELVTAAYRRSFFSGPDAPRVASARAGNVIGGGDWGEDRLIPDLVRAALAGAPLELRDPTATRPWQHVLNPLSGYLSLAEALWEAPEHAGAWNFGPAEADARPVGWIVERLVEQWYDPLEVHTAPGPHPHEAHFLKVDSSRARARLGWAPRWGLERTLESIVEWYEAYRRGAPVRGVSLAQIAAFAATDTTAAGARGAR